MLENQTQVRLGLTGGAANQLIPPLPPNVVGPTLNESDPSVCVCVCTHSVRVGMSVLLLYLSSVKSVCVCVCV